MSPRWIGRLRRVEIIFLLGASIFLCWTSFLQLIPMRDDGEDSILSGFVSTGTIFSSLDHFTLGDDGDGEHARHDVAITTDDAHPIYIAENTATGTGNFAVLDWDILSKKWDSNSSYADLLKDSTQMVDKNILPSTSSQSDSERIIFILHNHPKMASTTLRRACWENLRSTCDVVSPKRDPLGYSNSKDLASLLDKCENTHHFCVMGWHFNPDNFPNATLKSQAQPVTFLHLFPFRNFGDWAESAMKQVFVGHSEAGCNAVAKRLENCDGWLELDFAKYSKQALAQMLGIIQPRGQQQSDTHTHHLLLYDYSQVHSTLGQLSRFYNVPMMSYLDMRHKEIRQDGSCSGATLKKFHDCFDEQLKDV